MTFSTEEVLIIIGLMITVIGSLFVAFAFCMNKVVTLAKDLSSLNEKYDSLEASKFSQDERMNKLEQKQTAMDKEMSLSSYKLDTVLDEVAKISKNIGRIFDIMEKKQDKITP